MHNIVECACVCVVIYLTCTMAMGAVSVCLTVLVLNLHHRDNERPVPAWAQTLVLDYLASLRLLCVAGNQLRPRRTAENVKQVVCSTVVAAGSCHVIHYQQSSFPVSSPDLSF